MRIINIFRKIEATEASAIPQSQNGAEGTGVLRRFSEAGQEFMAQVSRQRFGTVEVVSDISVRLREAEAKKRFGQ